MVSVILQQAAEHAEPAIHPYVIGAGVLFILLALLVAVVWFGGGREHS